MTEWHKSSYSGGNNECVEVREHGGGADVRDTAHRELGGLAFPRHEWNGFLSSLQKNGGH
ncbi:hypothetical protein SUDANB121_05529 [Nocardiopsis dassonvillei]|uniref:DUF397 domain-containing protein n=1 Tax=Nocardiopsis dassonvillei TaxID=2014 RepID=UPI003F569F95